MAAAIRPTRIAGHRNLDGGRQRAGPRTLCKAEAELSRGDGRRKARRTVRRSSWTAVDVPDRQKWGSSRAVSRRNRSEDDRDAAEGAVIQALSTALSRLAVVTFPVE